jgi:hypothetical protein
MKLFMRITFFLNHVSVTRFGRGIGKNKYNLVASRTLKSWVQDTISTFKFVFPKHDFKKRLLAK